MRGFTVQIDDTETNAAMDAPELDRRRMEIDTVPVQSNQDGTQTGGSLNESAPASGQTVDRYRVVKLIAAGGTAHVYEAVHLFTRKPVALKIMRHSLAGCRDVAERFRQEAVALSSIRHANVVAVENAGLTEDGRVFIAMDLLIGKTLRHVLIHQRRLSLADTLDLMVQVASGVAAAHRACIVHRDLKPENIFCVTHGRAKILDLGTAKFSGEHTPTIQTVFGKVIGTAAYVAPERFNGDPGDARSDVYALGLIMYECLAGYHPMVPDGRWPSVSELASRQVTFRPNPVEGLPPVLHRIISKAIHKAPARRYQSVAEFRRALKSAQAQLILSSGAGTSVWQKLARTGLVNSIVAGSIFGVGVAGLAEWLRQAQTQTNVVAATASAAVLRVAAPARPDPSPTQEKPTVSAAQATSSAELPAVPGVENRPILPAGSPKSVKATEVVNRHSATQDRESTHLPHDSKDDLPASGL